MKQGQAAHRLPEGWVATPFSELLHQRVDYCRIPEPETETFVTVRLYGKGATKRKVGEGKTPTMSSGLRVRKGDLVYSRIDARNGAFAIVPPELDNAVVSKDFPSFEIMRSRASPAFLIAFLSTESFFGQLRASSFGTTNRQRITEEMLLSYRIPLPPLPEQERIVALLDAAEELRRKRAEADRRTGELVSAIFSEVLGDPVSNPKGWPSTPFSQLLAEPLRNGVSPSKRGTFAANVLTLSAITQGSFCPNAVKTAFFDDAFQPTKSVRKAYLLICRGNGNLHLVGSGRFSTDDLPDTVFPDTMIAAKVKPEVAENAFIEAVWNSPSVRSQLESGARTTNGTYKINQTVIEGVRFPVPPLHLQQQFSLRAGEIRSLQVRQAAARQRLDDLFQSMLHRAFRGEL